jgi:hypothetical protein
VSLKHPGERQSAQSRSDNDDGLLHAALLCRADTRRRWSAPKADGTSDLGKETLTDQNHLHRCTSDVRRVGPRNIAFRDLVTITRHQVRHWAAWHRHITLAMLALAFLTAVAADAAPQRPAGPNHFDHSLDPIMLTMPEIRRLFGAICNPPAASTARLLHWSIWRRRHRATARRSH